MNYLCEMARSKIIIPKADIGRALGHDSQSAASVARYAEAWERILRSAIRNQDGKRRTLTDYAQILDHWGIETAQGGRWTAKAVQRVLKANGVDAKTLYERINTRLAGLVKTWPIEAYQGLSQAEEPLYELSPENGTWKPLIEVWPSGGRVDVSCGRFVTSHGQPRTLPDHEEDFQIRREASLGKFEIYIFSFQRAATVEMIVSGSEMETFVWHLSREERNARLAKLRDRYLRNDNAIYKPTL